MAQVLYGTSRRGIAVLQRSKAIGTHLATYCETIFLTDDDFAAFCNN